MFLLFLQHQMCLRLVKQPYSKEKIGCGELKLIEMGNPTFDRETGKMTPFWESLALRDICKQKHGI